MDYNIGDTSAGSEYEIPLYVEDTEGMILYFVSAGEVFSVNSLNYILYKHQHPQRMNAGCAMIEMIIGTLFLFLFVSCGKQKIKKQCLTTLLLPVESITILLLITGL